MAIIEANGIRLETEVSSGILRFKVLKQSKDATKIMTILRQVSDPDENSKFTMRINKHPHFNRKSGIFFLRGCEKDKNDVWVNCELGSQAKVNQALEALRRLVENVKMPEGVDPEHHLDKEPLRGGTSDLRMAYITKAQAKKLHLTAKDYYKEERRWRNDTTPIVTVNHHYNEHIAQGVDILNKAFGRTTKTKGVVHPEKVSNADAKWTYDAICKLLDEAEKNGDGCLVAVWRAITSLRGPDHVDRSKLPSTHR